MLRVEFSSTSFDSFRQTADGSPLIQTLIINLASQPERQSACRSQIEPVLGEVRVVDAIDGHAEGFEVGNYPTLNRGHWWGRNAYKPGAFACYLSHMKAWQNIVDSHFDEALIVEDDVRVDQARLRQVVSAIPTQTFDLLFINFGSIRYLDEIDATRKSHLHPVGSTLEQMLKRGVLSDALQPGAYGYILRKSGAQKMLEITARDGIWMGVDFAMAFSALSARELARISALAQLPSSLTTYLQHTVNTTCSGRQRISVDASICDGPPPLLPDRTFASTIRHEIKREFR